MDIRQIITQVGIYNSKCKEENAESDLRIVKERVEKGPLQIVPSFPSCV